MKRKPELTSRSRSADFVRRAAYRDAILIVIATEGAVTEPHYLSLFSSIDSPFFNPKVKQIQILETENGNSAPEHVVNRLLEYKRENDISDRDQLWLVIDVDRWNQQGVLSPVISLAHTNGILLAISNPCFEVWLLCHFVETLPTVADFRDALQLNVGNAKTRFDLSRYVNRVRHATQIAAACSTNTDPNIPEALGSNVYKLVNQILPLNQSS